MDCGIAVQDKKQKPMLICKRIPGVLYRTSETNCRAADSMIDF